LGRVESWFGVRDRALSWNKNAWAVLAMADSCYWYRSLMPSCASFFESRNTRLGPSKSTFNAENFVRSFPRLSQLISAQFALEMCLAAQIRQKPIKPLSQRSRSFKVIEFGGSREPVHDFLLVINSNLNAIFHRY